MDGTPRMSFKVDTTKGFQLPLLGIIGTLEVLVARHALEGNALALHDGNVVSWHARLVCT